jgi:2-polyprenyl-6-methoxyphenol hydroxylase-like FAD-dependent oxidoreductase
MDRPSSPVVEQAGLPLHCLVVGGGIAGLTSAIALRQRGLQVSLIERDPEWSVYGVGIIQQSNVVRAMAVLGMLDEYLGSAFGFDVIRMFAPHGAHVATIPSPRLAGTAYPANVGIGRRALHKVLVGRAKSLGADIRLGVTVESFEDSGGHVAVSFSDGSSSVYDVMIGADGIHSQLRNRLFPNAPAPTFTGQAVWRYNLPRPQELHSLDVYEGRNGVGLVPLSESGMYLYLTTVEPGNPRLPTAGLAAAMRARLAGLPPRIAALTDAIAEDADVVYRPLETVFLEGPWHSGRVVLVGDAVHATTPHLGQGGGMAIEDSIVLAEELSSTPNDLPAAFARFHTRRFERCRFIVESSIAVGEYQLGRRDVLDYPALARRMFEVTSAPL